MAPACDQTNRAVIANRRNEIVVRLQVQIDTNAILNKNGHFACPLIYTSIHRGDMKYVEQVLIPTLRDRLRDSDGEPFAENVQLIGTLETEGDCVCERAPCCCAIRRTLKVTTRKRRGAPADIQDANGN
jgi:hypothetical protein